MANPRRGRPNQVKVKADKKGPKLTEPCISIPPSCPPLYRNQSNDSISSLSDSDGSVCYSSTEIDIDDNPSRRAWDDGSTKKTRQKCCPKKCSRDSSSTCCCDSDSTSCSLHHKCDSSCGCHHDSHHCPQPIVPLCPPYVQEGFLSYFDASTVSTVPIAQRIDFARRQSIDFWLRDVTGIWHQPGDFLANYALQISPGVESGLYTIAVVLPANTNYVMGSAYSLVISFRSRLLDEPECDDGQCQQLSNPEIPLN